MERQYSLLQLKLEPIERMMMATKDQQFKLSQELNNLTEKYLKEVDKGKDLQQKLDILGDYNMDELKHELERARKSEKDLEGQLKIMVENPWFTIDADKANITQQLRVRPS